MYKINDVLSCYRSVTYVETIIENTSLTVIQFRCKISEYGANSLARITQSCKDIANIEISTTVKKERKANARTLRYNLTVKNEDVETLINCLIENFNEEEQLEYNYLLKRIK